MQFIKNLIISTLTINATKHPTPNIISSPASNTNPTFNMYLSNFKSEAPTITGIAKKNVNSAATLLLSPAISPPIIVAPLLLVPGINDNEEYKSIECILYEKHDDIEKKISSYKFNKAITLEDFLKKVT